MIQTLRSEPVSISVCCKELLIKSQRTTYNSKKL